MLSDQEPVIVVRHCRQNLPRQKMTADLSKGKAPYVQKNQSKSDSEQAGDTKYIAERDATKTKTVEVTRIKSEKAVVISSDTKSAQTRSSNDDSSSVQGLLSTKIFNQSLMCLLRKSVLCLPLMQSLEHLAVQVAQRLHHSSSWRWQVSGEFYRSLSLFREASGGDGMYRALKRT